MKKQPTIKQKTSKKKRVLEKLFWHCKKNSEFQFDNDLVKKFCKEEKFGNPFDVTKLDNTKIFPDVLLQEDYFVVHLGKGIHQFVKGISKAYHQFETIEEKNIINWEYKQSILNDFDTSESNVLSLASNQKIIHDFLYDDIIASPKVYGAHRTTANLKYYIGDFPVTTQKLQMEIDLTMEMDGNVTVMEGKNGFPKDFAIYQIFHPFLYYHNLKSAHTLPIKNINCCYLLRKKINNNSILCIYKYGFSKEDDLSSVTLQKAKQYNLFLK